MYTYIPSIIRAGVLKENDPDFGYVIGRDIVISTNHKPNIWVIRFVNTGPAVLFCCAKAKGSICLYVK